MRQKISRTRFVFAKSTLLDIRIGSFCYIGRETQMPLTPLLKRDREEVMKHEKKRF